MSKYQSSYKKTFSKPARTYTPKSRVYPNRAKVTNAAIKKAVMQSQETKYFDVGFNVTIANPTADWSGTNVPMDNYINASGTPAAYTDSALIPSANGSGYGQVVGNKYHLQKIRVRGRIVRNVTSNANACLDGANVRIILIHDTQPNGSQALGQDIMQDTGDSLENEFSFQRVANSLGRFRILKDEFIEINPAAAVYNGTNASNSFTQGTFSFQYKPKSPIQCTIKSGNATPTVAGLVDTNIFLLMYPSSSNLNIYGVSRAYYKDS